MSAARAAALPPGAALSSLIYLDWHIFLNRLRAIRRDPKRLAMWIFFALVILFAIPQVFFIRGTADPLAWGPRSSRLFMILDAAAGFVPGVALLWLGLAVAGSQRPVAVFRSAADARFLTGSALPARVVVFWLTFRMIRTAVLQLPGVAFWFVILASNLKGAFFGILTFWATLALFFAFRIGLNLPLVKLRRRRPRAPLIAGIVLAVLGIASVGIAANHLAHSSLAVPGGDLLLGLPPGSWMLGGFKGEVWALLALASCAAAAFTFTVQVSKDVYPEIWEASVRMIAVRRMMRARGGILTPFEARQAMRQAGVSPAQPRTRTAPSISGRYVPPGAWTLLWKEWLATLRVRGGLRWPLTLLILAVLVGWAAGGGFGRLPTVVILNVIGLPIYLLVAVNVLMSFRLGVDLRNPLWWLSSASLQARLLVLTLARSLRQVVPLAAGLLAAAVAARSVLVFALGVPAFAAMVWALQAMGIGTYTIIPSPGDLRGPGQVLRMFFVMLLLFPLAILFTIGTAVSGQPAVGLLMAAATAALEGWGLLAFAAGRLEGNGLAFAQAERR